MEMGTFWSSYALTLSTTFWWLIIHLVDYFFWSNRLILKSFVFLW